MPDPQDAMVQAIFDRNAQYTTPGNNQYITPPSVGEPGFQSWVSQNKVPYDPSPTADYDMRGFYNALMRGDPKAQSAIDPNDAKMHYPDYWKTPYHETFSNQSQWATQMAPRWTPDDKLVSSRGQILFDDRNQPDPNDPILRALRHL